MVPDIHLRHEQAEAIIAAAGDVDRIVFLGDYFDDWQSTPQASAATARWLRASLREPRRTHLWGNHDIHHYNPAFACGGWSEANYRAIQEVLRREDWYRLKWYAWADNWFCSHAGLHPYWWPQPQVASRAELSAWLDLHLVAAGAAAGAGRPHWTNISGSARNGPAPVGGLLWLDFKREFEPLPGLDQLVGHSRRVRWIETATSRNCCLDSAGTAALVEDGEVTVLQLSEGGLVSDSRSDGQLRSADAVKRASRIRVGPARP